MSALLLLASLSWAACDAVCDKEPRLDCRACVAGSAERGEDPPGEAVFAAAFRGMDKPELEKLLKLHRAKAAEIEKETRDDAPASRLAAIGLLERRLEELEAAEDPGDLSDEAYCATYPKFCILDDTEKPTPRPESLVRAARKEREARAAKEGACFGSKNGPCVSSCPRKYDFADRRPGKRHRTKPDPECVKTCQEKAKLACGAD